MKLFFTFILVIVVISTKAQIPYNGLLIYYPFDGNSKDSSGNSYHGTGYGVNYASDRFDIPNTACLFDGVDDFIELPNLLELKPDLPVSFSFWVKYKSIGFGHRIVFNTSMESDRSSGVCFVYEAGTGKYVTSFGDGTQYFSPMTRRTFVSNTVIDTVDWHYIIAVVNGPTNMKIYVDCEDSGGHYVGTGGDLYYSDYPGCIGRHDSNTTLDDLFFKGILDEFRYWNRELTSIEIETFCPDELNREEPEPKAEPEIHGLLIYPNPAELEVNFKSDIAGLSTIRIFDLAGQKVYEGDFEPKIYINFLATGMYIFEVSDSANTERYREKVVVRALKRYYRF